MTRGDEVAHARILDVCRRHPEMWDEGHDGATHSAEGTIVARYTTAYAPRWEIAYEVSLVVPDTVIRLEYAEPMLVTFGTVEFLNGHVLRFWERIDRDVWEWSGDTGIYREITLTYLDPNDPYGPTTEYVDHESIRGESEMFADPDDDLDLTLAEQDQGSPLRSETDGATDGGDE